EIRKPLISSSSLKIIENIQLLLECKHDRDEHLYQVLGKAQNDSKIDPILIHNCSDEDQNTEEDDPEQLLQMLSFVNETTTNAYYASTGNQEQRYLNDALQAIDNAHRRNIETRRDKARISLISGVDTLEVRDDEMQIEVVTVEIPTSPYKAQTTMVPPVTATMAVSFPTKPDTIKEFTLNCQQKYAFMIVTNHLDGENQLHTDTSDNQLLMCVPDCGGTGKSQLIRAITNITTHKNQGQALNKIIVDLVTLPGPVEVVSAYVPLSCVKRLDDLLIVRSFEFSSLQVKPSAAQLEELKRLDTIAKNTRKRFPSIL
ncbi:unnamed protein product, partial [Rotaria sp. Silwood2]